MNVSNAPGMWTTQTTDVFTINVPRAEATALCARAVEETKGWKVTETGTDRLVVKSSPGFIDMRSYSVEILLGEAPHGATTCTLHGWTFGKGIGMTKMVGRANSKLQAAIETHAQ